MCTPEIFGRMMLKILNAPDAEKLQSKESAIAWSAWIKTENALVAEKYWMEFSKLNNFFKPLL